MAEQVHKQKWRVIGGSSQGTAHVRSGQPNQDAWSFWLPKSGTGPPAIAAVSDGHGGSPHFRSHIGARLAVEAATHILRAFADEWSQIGDLETLNDAAVRELPRRLVELWRQDASAHLAANPITEKEWAILTGKEESRSSELVRSNPLLAYGATILGVLAAGTVTVYLQLGDGDILCVANTGETIRPLPPDPRLMANETTSLCALDAWKDFRVRVVTNMGNIPTLILLCTDGYANSFRTEEDFLKVGSDYLELIRHNGLHHVQQVLEEILGDTSANGSGDDVTITLLQRIEDGEEAMRDSEARFTALETSLNELNDKQKCLDGRLTLTRRMSILALVLAILGLTLGLWNSRSRAGQRQNSNKLSHTASESLTFKCASLDLAQFGEGRHSF